MVNLLVAPGYSCAWLSGGPDWTGLLLVCSLLVGLLLAAPGWSWSWLLAGPGWSTDIVSNASSCIAVVSLWPVWACVTLQRPPQKYIALLNLFSFVFLTLALFLLVCARDIHRYGFEGKLMYCSCESAAGIGSGVTLQRQPQK